MEKKPILTYLLFPILLTTDILTKSYFLDKQYKIIPGVLEIANIKNTGIAFGLFKGSILFTIIIPILAVILLFYFFYNRKEPLAKVGLLLTVSGLVGNLISRFIYGYVPDFIYVPLLSFVVQVFNFADFFTFVGIILLTIYLLKVR